METLLARDPNDVASRFVTLRIFFVLSYWSFSEKELEVSAFRSSCNRHLAELVRLRDVEACVDQRDIEWEIVNACAVSDWERANQLHDRLRQSSSSEATSYLEKGRFLFQSVVNGGDSYDEKDEIVEPWLALWRPPSTGA